MMYITITYMSTSKKASNMVGERKKKDMKFNGIIFWEDKNAMHFAVPSYLPNEKILGCKQHLRKITRFTTEMNKALTNNITLIHQIEDY